ncbi:MAG: hypothetical protein GWP35_01920, partial [Proteobacteria bacterium]|nr:hypothetical protein [Pseudomonadota bacterium]
MAWPKSNIILFIATLLLAVVPIVPGLGTADLHPLEAQVLDIPFVELFHSTGEEVF